LCPDAYGLIDEHGKPLEGEFADYKPLLPALSAFNCPVVVNIS
jgi:hypothetical protein